MERAYPGRVKNIRLDGGEGKGNIRRNRMFVYIMTKETLFNLHGTGAGPAKAAASALAATSTAAEDVHRAEVGAGSLAAAAGSLTASTAAGSVDSDPPRVTAAAASGRYETQGEGTRRSKRKAAR